MKKLNQNLYNNDATYAVEQLCFSCFQYKNVDDISSWETLVQRSKLDEIRQ